MKRFSYNQNEGKIEFEKESRRKKRNWGKIIYQGIIGSIIVSLVFYLLVKSLFSISTGEVQVNRFSVYFPYAIKIEDFKVAENDTVKLGQALFSYNTAQSIEMISNDSELWLLRERIALQQKINLLKIEFDKIEQELEVEKAYLQKVSLMVDQNVVSKAMYDEQVYKINQLEIDVETTARQIEFYGDEYNKFHFEYKNKSLSYNTGGARLYHSPIAGEVNRILATNHEYIDKTDVMKLINNDDVYIYAYVRIRHMGHFPVGDRVTVVFPDYQTGSGYVEHIYKEVEQLPEDLRRLDNSRYVLLKLRPADVEEKERWSRLDGNMVKVVALNMRHLF